MDQEWDEIKQRWESMDPELRGQYQGMMDSWFWNHPRNEETSRHAIPALPKYQEAGAEIFWNARDFDPEDLRAVFEYMDGEGAIWWTKPLVEDGQLWVEVATTENATGIPVDWDDRARFDLDEWQEAINQWVSGTPR